MEQDPGDMFMREGGQKGRIDMLEVHFAGVIAKLSHADGSYEYIYIQVIEDYLDCIFAK
jgi:hypothetical protein